MIARVDQGIFTPGDVKASDIGRPVGKNTVRSRLDGDKGGSYRLSEINIAWLPEGNDTVASDALGSLQDKKGSGNQARGPLPDTNEPIDLLVLITKRVVKELGGIEKAIPEMELLIAETNNVYR